MDLIRVSLKRGLLLSCGRVPQFDLSFAELSTAGGERLAVRAEGHAIDVVRMSLECGAFLSRGHVPQLDRLVHAAGSESLAVRAEGHRPNGTGVSLERGA